MNTQEDYREIQTLKVIPPDGRMVLILGNRQCSTAHCTNPASIMRDARGRRAWCPAHFPFKLDPATDRADRDRAIIDATLAQVNEGDRPYLEQIDIAAIIAEADGS